jgi:hypothetical protein
MTQISHDTSSVQTGAETDLVAAVQRVLAASDEPHTVSKLRSRLPAPFRTASLEELSDVLGRQVAAGVLHRYPKYRSAQDRYWDRPMPVHVVALVQELLRERPYSWPELRRKLPGYALPQAEEVLREQVAQGKLYQHPRAGKRGSERYGLRPADPKDYLRESLAVVFREVGELGFTEGQLRAAALELLHDEEWSPSARPAVEETTHELASDSAEERSPEPTLEQAETDAEAQGAGQV